MARNSLFEANLFYSEIDFLIDRCLNIINWFILALTILSENLGQSKKRVQKANRINNKIRKNTFPLSKLFLWVHHSLIGEQVH